MKTMGLGSARVARAWFRRLAETISPEAYASRLRREMEEKFAIAGRNRQTRETRALPRRNRNSAIEFT
jgi:hypothetical protein